MLVAGREIIFRKIDDSKILQKTHPFIVFVVQAAVLDLGHVKRMDNNLRLPGCENKSIGKSLRAATQKQTQSLHKKNNP